MDSEILLYNEIGKKIKLRREEIGLTHEDVAKITNYSHSFIASIENDTYQSFSIGALNNIAKALKTTMKNLLPDEPDIVYSNNLHCKYCDYETKVPIEIIKICQNIKEVSMGNLSLTCPKCQKKIMF